MKALDLSKSKKLYKEGLNHLVGSVNSPVRAFSSVGGDPLFIDRGDGPYVYDADNNKYIDYVGSYGPMILGHAHPRVLASVKKACEKSFSFGATGEKEIRLAELIKETTPGIDKVRFVNSGTEAVFSALRLSRAYTGRTKIIKLSGCYHGHADSLLVAAGSGLVTLGLPGSEGVPENAVSDTLVAPYNDIEAIKELFQTFKNQIAAVIIEPVAGNMGVVLPKDNYLKSLKELTQSHGSLLIADEVMTGFRAKLGTAHSMYGIVADIICFGKVIGGGFPVGAYAAKREIMDMVAPLGPVYQAGTLSGNPIAMTAGIATLEVLKEENPYPKLNTYAAELEEHFLNESKLRSLPLKVNRFGSMISAFFTNSEITNFEDSQKCNTEQFSKYFWSMIENGIFLPPSQYEACFLSASLNEDCINKTKEAISNSFRIL